MAGGGGGMSNFASLIQNRRVPCGSDPASCIPFLGSRSVMNFEDVLGGNGINGTFLRLFNQVENGEEELDDYFLQPSKKRRLTEDQVKSLEQSFEMENKLEPERKIQLAKALGLQPRQVAIWFQNRRARWKTKQVEKGYDDLQTSYNSLKADYDTLQIENDKLKTEVLLLKERAANTIALSGTEQVCKNEEFSSTISGTFRAYNLHSSEVDDSSYVFEPDKSDLSQGDEDNSIKNILPPYIFPKPEEGNYSDPPTNLCNFGISGISVEDNAFWTWSY